MDDKSDARIQALKSEEATFEPAYTSSNVPAAAARMRYSSSPPEIHFTVIHIKQVSSDHTSNQSLIMSSSREMMHDAWTRPITVHGG